MIVDKIGSHFGDLQSAIKIFSDLKCSEKQKSIQFDSKKLCEGIYCYLLWILLLLVVILIVAVETVVTQYIQQFHLAIREPRMSNKLYTAEQFRLIAYYTFEALSKSPLVPISIHEIYQEAMKFNIKSNAIEGTLSTLVLLSLITFPSTIRPSTISWCHRSLQPAWNIAKENIVLITCIDESKKELAK